MNVEIVEKAKKRDEMAFLEMMKQVEIDLYKTAYSFLHSDHEALEAIQEVTVRIYQQIHKLRQPVYAKTWMIRIMINYCQDQLKRKRPLLPLFTRSEPGRGQHKAFTFMELLQGLPPDRQRLLFYRYYLQASIEEIANVEGIPTGTVKSRIHTSLQKLRTTITQQGGDADVFERQMDISSRPRMESD